MRNRLPFSCPTCGAELGASPSCARCAVAGRDADGRPPVGLRLRSHRLEGWWPWWLAILPAGGVVLALQLRREAPLSPLLIGLLIGGALLASFLLTFLLRWRSTRAWVRDRAARRRATQRRARSGILRAIVDAEGEESRVRGRVRTIRPVRTPEGDLVAAFRSRRTEPAPGDPGSRAREVVETAASGRFAVDDGSGVAIVDDDAFSLEPLDVDGRGGTIALRDGDLVEVVGPARREPLPEDVASPTFGEDGTALVFDGRPDRPLLLLPLPLEASMAPPRSRAFGVPTRPGPQTLEHDALHEIEAGGRADAEARGPTTGPGH